MSLLLLFGGEGTAPPATPDIGWLTQFDFRPGFKARLLSEAAFVPPVEAPAQDYFFGWNNPFTESRKLRRQISDDPAFVSPAARAPLVGWYTIGIPSVVIPAQAAPEFGWYAAFENVKVKTKPRAEESGYVPQTIAAPAQTLFLGWYGQFDGAPKRKLNFAPDASPFVAQPAPTSFGWYVPFEASRSKKLTLNNSEVVNVFPAVAAAAVDQPLGWYFQFTGRAVRRKALADSWSFFPREQAATAHDCGHLYPSAGAGADLIPGAISKAGATRSSASKGGSLKPEIPC